MENEFVKNYVQIKGKYFCYCYCVIVAPFSGSTMPFINELVKEAKKDFPWLNEDAIHLRIYSHKEELPYKGNFGIEFHIPLDTAPEGYTELPRWLELAR